MSAPAKNKRRLKDNTKRLLRQAFVRGEPHDFLKELMSQGELALIGGAIRDAYLQGVKEFKSDFDFVIHPRVLSDFIRFVRSHGAQENRFGGFGLEINRWKIDVWPLQLTWAHTHGHYRVESFQDLLSVTFFDWDAVVYNLSTDNVLLFADYFERVENRVLDVNLLPNPNPLGNAVRAIRYACRWNASFGPTLARHVHQMLCEHGHQSFLSAERKSFHSAFLTPLVLEAVGNTLAAAVKNASQGPINVLEHYQPQKTFFSLFDGVQAGDDCSRLLSGQSDAAPYDARAVANFLLDLAGSRHIPLTQMSLLKLIYFAHGWYLSKTGKRLVEQDFEAWQYGPVVKVVRDAFGGAGKDPITTRAEKLDIFSGRCTTVASALAAEDARFVATIFDAYHVHDAWKLSNMTHETGSPWDQLWNAAEPVGRLALRIKDEEIKSHFDGLTKRVPLS